MGGGSLEIIDQLLPSRNFTAYQKTANLTNVYLEMNKKLTGREGIARSPKLPGALLRQDRQSLG